MASRNQADLWRDLVAEAGEDAILGASQVTGPDAERDLRRAGFDIAKERAKAGALLRVLDSKEAPVDDSGEPSSEDQAWVARVQPTPIRSRAPSTRWVWLVAATLAVATMGGLLYGLAHRPKPVDLPREVPTLEDPTPTPAPRGDVPPVAPSETEEPRMVGPKSWTTGGKAH